MQSFALLTTRLSFFDVPSHEPGDRADPNGAFGISPIHADFGRNPLFIAARCVLLRAGS
jgi:hypothetical protein